MRKIFVIYLLIAANILSAQTEFSLVESEEAQLKLNEEFLNIETSILNTEDFKNFDGLKFYPLNAKYIVQARFVRTPNEKPFLMPTTTERSPKYSKYGEAHFNLEEKDLVLSLYKSFQPNTKEEYEDYLFLPFTDLTSGNGSYGGGRYLDLKIPDGNTIIIDFNKAYNPYCAYSPKYSCPIPPQENDILVHIDAGVKDFLRP